MRKFVKYHFIRMGGVLQKWRLAISGNSISRFVLIKTFVTTLVVISYSVSIAGESKVGKNDPDRNNEPIQVTADQLVSNNEERYAEFIGNVKATQGNFVITSDKLRIYYQGDLLKSEKQSKNEDLVKKIEATGNVKIESEQFTAETDKVEYDTATMTFILTGDNSKILSGKNYVRGSKITFYQKDRRFKVERGKNSRIKALFYPNDKTSDDIEFKKSN